MNSCPKRKARNQPANRRDKKEQRGSSTYADAVTGGVLTGSAVAIDTATGGTQSVSSHQESIEVLEEMPEAPVLPTAPDISVDETSGDKDPDHPENHPLYKLAMLGITELKERMEEQKRKEEKELRKQAKKEEEEAKMKSPPRKKKNFSLYKN